MAMPYIAKLLAGVTGGLSLLAYGIYQAVEAARSGDWLAGIKIAAGAFVGAGFDTLGDIIGRVGSIAGAAVKGFQAIKSRNLGGLIDAFATGAEGIAGFAKNQLGGFAKTCRKWADAARTWGGYAMAGVGVFQSIKGKDPLAAIAGSLDLVVSLRDHGQRDMMGPPTSLSNNPGVLVTSARLFGYARDAQDAATGSPPRWGAFAANMFDMAGEYTDSGKVGTGRDLALYTQNFDTAYRSGDWSTAGQALLDISQTIDLAHRGDDISDEEQEQVTGRYDVAGTIITPGLQTVENIQTGNWAAALESGLTAAKNTELARAEPEDRERINDKYKTLDRYLEPSVGCANALATGDWSLVAMFASQLGGELSRNGRFDTGAFFTQRAALMITKIESGDLEGAFAIGKELWGELEGLWGDTPKGTVEDVGAGSPDTKDSGIAPPPTPGGETGTGSLREGPPGDVDATALTIAKSMVMRSSNSVGWEGRGYGWIRKDFGTPTQGESDLVAQEMANMPFYGLVKLCKTNPPASVMVCRGNVATAYPDLKDDHPEGWPPWMTWKDCVGAYLPGPKQAVIAIREGKVPETGNGHGSVNLVVHEVGHAIDHAFDGKSDPAFQEARSACIARLQQEGRDFPAYESQPQAGARESYAESMARFFRPGGPLLVDIEKYRELWAYWKNHHMRRRAQC
jgi:hypothetical protein